MRLLGQHPYRDVVWIFDTSPLEVPLADLALAILELQLAPVAIHPPPRDRGPCGARVVAELDLRKVSLGKLRLRHSMGNLPLRMSQKPFREINLTGSGSGSGPGFGPDSGTAAFPIECNLLLASFNIPEMNPETSPINKPDRVWV